MGVLRSERLGAIWFGMGLLACMSVEWWRWSHPVDTPELKVSELLGVLGAMEVEPRVKWPDSASDPETGAGRRNRGFPAITGPIEVAELDSAGWVSHGLTPKQAASAVRYAAAVGGLVSRSQIERMRVLPSGWLEHHSAHLRFSDSQPVRHHQTASYGAAVHSTREQAPGPLQIDINSADSAALVALPGVGPWVAERILTARHQWGGIADLSLLSEALNGWDSLAAVVRPHFSCNPRDVVVRCPDSLSVEQWKALPYVDWNRARVLERTARHHRGKVQTVLDHPTLDSLERTIIGHYLVDCGGGG